MASPRASSVATGELALAEPLAFEDLLRLLTVEHERVREECNRLRSVHGRPDVDDVATVWHEPSAFRRLQTPVSAKPAAFLRNQTPTHLAMLPMTPMCRLVTDMNPTGLPTLGTHESMEKVAAKMTAEHTLRMHAAYPTPEDDMPSFFGSAPLGSMDSTKTESKKGGRRTLSENIGENIVDPQFSSNRSHSFGSEDGKVTCKCAGICSVCSSCGEERLEPQDVNMTELTEQQYPGREWNSLHPHEQADLIRHGLKAKHFLLDPHSQYMRCWDCLIIVCLVLTALLTPYEVSFVSLHFGPFFILNRGLDLVFIKDMLLHFFLKVEGKRKDGWGTVIVRDPKVIRKMYLRGWFLIDLVTIFPLDIIIFMSEANPDSMLGRAKILRSLRVLRLVKLLRILKTSRLVLRWQNYLGISFAVQKLVKFICVLLVASHWMACLWGFVGQAFTGKDVCDADGVQIMFDRPPRSQASWVTTVFLEGGKHSPDNPCKHLHLYASSLHWSVMTITSIGYGDIYPVRFEEYLVCVCCQIVGAMSWAFIIGSTCSILCNTDPVEEKFETATDLLNTTMREARVPRNIQCVYREYLREAKRHDANQLFRDMAGSFSPLLRGYLMVHISEKWISNIYYFRDAPPAAMVEVAERLSALFYSRREPLHEIRSCLCIIERGTIAHGGVVVTNGSVFQLDMIISNRALHDVRPTVSLTYCEVLILTRPNLNGILEKHPGFRKRMRGHAAKFALARFVRFSAQQAKTIIALGLPAPSLADAFEALEKVEAERAIMDAATNTSDQPKLPQPKFVQR